MREIQRERKKEARPGLHAYGARESSTALFDVKIIGNLNVLKSHTF